MVHLTSFTTALVLVDAVLAASFCKTTPNDADWPSLEDWSALNASIDGTLLKTSPVASSCWAGNPFNSTVSCNTVEDDWDLSTFHAAQPESIDYPLYANNSCLPPGADGYSKTKGCIVGALPQYIVNASTAEHIATSLAWASSRNIRIVVKGTGHDINGRSSGAYSISIWTHNFNELDFVSSWSLPNCSEKIDVVVAGSGNNWNTVYTAAEAQGKAVVGGGAKTVGLGGLIQGGGHGPLTSHYGLAADQILQATVVTTEGDIPVANSQQNKDLLWAIRGGGAGQYGVVTEYVLKTYPAPSNAILGTMTLSTNGTDSASIKSVWEAFAVQVRSIPDLMDSGFAGVLTAIGSKLDAGRMVSISHEIYRYNTTAANMSALVTPIIAEMESQAGNTSLSVGWSEPLTFSNFTSFFNYLNPSQAEEAGASSMLSSRLREQLNNLTQSEVAAYLEIVMTPESETGGGYLIMVMQGGRGPANVAESMRGALNPVWRTAYLHTINLGVSINSTVAPKIALASSAEWINNNTEKVWQEWAPNTGAYMNEANPYNPNFKHDYYGVNYDRLVDIKRKYDPTESLFVLTGVESDSWDYDLDTGTLCKTV